MAWDVEYTDEFAILLIGGDKTGDDLWYEWFIPLADRLYDEHLETLKREGAGDG